MLKKSSSLRTQILSLSKPSIPCNDHNEFTVKSIDGGYMSHSFMVKINSQNNNDTSPDSFFVKINIRKHAQQMFDAEIIGSHAMLEVCTLFSRIPQPIGTGNMSTVGNDNQGSWFLAEYISAEKHRLSPHGGLFGFHVNNFFVHTEQDNAWNSDWCSFYLEKRLKTVLLRMKCDTDLINHYDKNMELILLCDRLIPYVPWFLNTAQAQIQLCLLHGDFNGRNWSIDENDNLAMFDGPYEVDIYPMPHTFI
ncbi:unnamed protein product [Rotaria socialis]|uniref:protein-ribulosamine 3-kinase n=1 Tax=Rotaria socialis TaxID=392032 RepID=A0A821UN33_9BILA|nr:unnamed protein product [Rotaria socialis]